MKYKFALIMSVAHIFGGSTDTILFFKNVKEAKPVFEENRKDPYNLVCRLFKIKPIKDKFNDKITLIKEIKL